MQEITIKEIINNATEWGGCTIGLVGAKGVGKTLTAQIIKNTASRVEVRSFATPIKDDVHIRLGLAVPNNPYEKELIRPIYQTLGDYYRGLDEDYYTNIMLNKHIQHITDDQMLIIDDVRFPNEANCCDILIYITRENVGYTGEHKSENPEMKDICDYVLDIGFEAEDYIKVDKNV